MPKAATITQIEHSIETLPPADQFKLLEKMVKHLKNSFLNNDAVVRKNMGDAEAIVTLRGALKHYANPELHKNETDAFAQVMKVKYALH